jgi:magnesium transporter
MPVNAIQIEMLRKLLRHGAKERVVKTFDKFRPAELSDIFAVLSPAEQRQFLDVLFEQGSAAETLAELPEGILLEVLAGMKDERIGRVLKRLPIDDAASFVSMLDDDRIARVLAFVDDMRRERIEHLRTYPAESAGSLMTSDMLTLGEAMTVGEAIDVLRDKAADSEFIFYLYVIGDASTFLGVVPIRRLIVAKPESALSDIMVTNPIAVHADDDQEYVAEITARYNLLAVPVVDQNFGLLGVITVDDVIDVLQEEATEDMYLMHGLSDEDRVYSPMSVSIRKRLPWMVLNLGCAFLAAAVVGFFEESIAEVVILATFMPIVANVGGNGGTQTLTVVTRAMALGEMEYTDGWSAVGKQLGIGISVGACVGVVAGLIAWYWKGIPFLGLVLFLAMLINLAVAGLAGALVPMILRALKQDPAMGGGVIITTFTDVVGFFSFLGLATAFLEHLK